MKKTIILRQEVLDQIEMAFQVHPVVALLGPRQCGKTTLAKEYAKRYFKLPRPNYFDLEDELDLLRLENPKWTLSELSGLIVMDEIQLLPDIFKPLRVLVDEERSQRRYLILGSASRDLIHQSSETLAGRIQYIELTPLSYHDGLDLNKYWLRGGFPPAYLADNNEKSVIWRKAYIKTYLERDIPNLGINIPAQTLRRFWQMLTHYHGALFNAAELGASFGIAGTTVRRYLDILCGTFMVRELMPWAENISKRQIKSPKIYFRDSGIYHTLLNINDRDDLLINPKLGVSWEGMALEEIIRYHQVESEDCYFWGVHSQAELDLLIFQGNKRLGFEFKFSEKPQLTKSMRMALEILELDRLTVISPGNHDFPLAEKIRAIGLEKYAASKL